MPVPGATITAVQGHEQRVTVTDPQGIYRFIGIAEGVWTMRVEMVGFATTTRDITIGPDSPPARIRSAVSRRRPALIFLEVPEWHS